MPIHRKIGWCLFSLFLGLAFFSEPMWLYSKEERLDSAAFVCVYVFLTSLVFLSLVLWLGRSNRLFFHFLNTLYLVVALVFLKLIYFEQIAGLPTAAQSFLFLALVCLTFFLLQTLEQRGVGFTRMVLISTLLFVVIPILAIERKMSGSAPQTTLQEGDYLRVLSQTQFSTRPNIYLLSYDSMIPEYSARKYLELDELSYSRALDKYFVRLNPAISVNVPTKPSLNGLMQMDQTQLGSSDHYFSGKKQSAVSAIFKSNGYSLTTGYTSYFFGWKGPHVDRYVIGSLPAIEKTIFCADFNASVYQALHAFGACKHIGRYSGLADFRDVHFARGNEANSAPETWSARILREIEQGAQHPSPQIMLYYIYRPNGHTAVDYRHSDSSMREGYRNHFKRQARILDGLLEHLAETINRVDPNSIVVVFGDHGAWLSRHASASESPRFFYEDRHLVEMAVLKTNNRCVDEVSLGAYREDFFTPSRVLAAVVRCLSDNGESLDAVFDFITPEGKDFILGPDQITFSPEWM